MAPGIQLAVLLLSLPSLVHSCPDHCQCLPLNTDVRCTDGAMREFPSLSPRTIKLDMSNSKLRSSVLQKTNFTGLENLEELRLSGCGITHIEYHTFTDMYKLKSLDLSFNNLNVISMGALSGLRLVYLDMDNNPTLRLQDNTFSGMSTVVLNLKRCELSDARPAIFQPLKGQLRKLFLNENKIVRFSPLILDLFEAVEEVRIFDNPLICDCKSKWLKEFYDLNKDSNKIRSARTSGEEPRCATPLEMKGTFFRDLSIRDFSCDPPTLKADVFFTKDKAVLSCESTGNPIPNVTWVSSTGIWKKSLPASNVRVNKNQLEVLATDPSSNGKYRCIASNDGGNISFNVNVALPFTSGDTGTSEPDRCKTDVIESTTQDVDLSNVDGKEADTETDVFKIKCLTLVDLVGAILGTFVCTLLVTIVTLHFCVYRRKKTSQHTTPPMSEHSNSSNGNDKNGQCPVSLHTLHTSHMQSQSPLPNKPYTNKMYDENHYMASNIEERDEFLPMQSRVTPASSCDTTC